MNVTIIESLESIAYLAMDVSSVQDRRILDRVLQMTETSVDQEEEATASTV